MTTKIKIAKCPHCGQSHQLILEPIKKDIYIVMAFETRDEQEHQKSRRQVLRCPVTGKLFEAVLPLLGNKEDYDATVVPDDD